MSPDGSPISIRLSGATLRSQYRVDRHQARRRISDAEINAALSSMWKKTPETASRTEQRIKRVISWVKEVKLTPPTNAASAKQRRLYRSHPLWHAAPDGVTGPATWLRHGRVGRNSGGG